MHLFLAVVIHTFLLALRTFHLGSGPSLLYLCAHKISCKSPEFIYDTIRYEVKVQCSKNNSGLFAYVLLIKNKNYSILYK